MPDEVDRLVGEGREGGEAAKEARYVEGPKAPRAEAVLDEAQG